MHEQLRGEVDDLNVKYNNMKASVDKEIKDIRSCLAEEVTERKEEIGKITEEIKDKEEELRKVKY